MPLHLYLSDFERYSITNVISISFQDQITCWSVECVFETNLSFDFIMCSKLFLLIIVLIYKMCDCSKEECHLRPVIHVLQHPGCIPKPIPSFACYGTCSSYVQVRYFLINNMLYD